MVGLEVWPRGPLAETRLAGGSPPGHPTYTSVGFRCALGMVGQMPPTCLCQPISPRPSAPRCLPHPWLWSQGRGCRPVPTASKAWSGGEQEAVTLGVGAGLWCGAVCRSWGIRGQGQLWARSVLGVCGCGASWVTGCRVPGRLLGLSLEDGETSEGGGGLGTPRTRGPARGSRQGWPRVSQWDLSGAGAAKAAWGP